MTSRCIETRTSCKFARTKSAPPAKTSTITSSRGRKRPIRCVHKIRILATDQYWSENQENSLRGKLEGGWESSPDCSAQKRRQPNRQQWATALFARGHARIITLHVLARLNAPLSGRRHQRRHAGDAQEHFHATSLAGASPIRPPCDFDDNFNFPMSRLATRVLLCYYRLWSVMKS